jgi:RNA polymerase sigma factor for flagellar operon FliA
MARHPALAQRLLVRPDAAHTVPLWAAFRQSGDPSVREQLVGAYLGFTRVMAAKVYARRPNADNALRANDAMEFGDYLQYASVGLLEAVDRFDPQHGVLFETFAASRITGAVLTGLESASEISRQIAARKRVNGQRAASLDGDVPALTGPEAVFARLADIALGLAVGFALEESNMYVQEEGAYADNTYAALELKQLRGRVSAALGSLSPSHRRVMQSHYLQQMPFDDVAASMSLTRGRISQLHSEALDKLRDLLKRNCPVDLYC